MFSMAKMVQRLADGFDGCLHAGLEALAYAIEAGDPEAASRTVIENFDCCMSWMHPILYSLELNSHSSIEAKLVGSL